MRKVGLHILTLILAPVIGQQRSFGESSHIARLESYAVDTEKALSERASQSIRDLLSRSAFGALEAASIEDLYNLEIVVTPARERLVADRQKWRSDRAAGRKAEYLAFVESKAKDAESELPSEEPTKVEKLGMFSIGGIVFPNEKDSLKDTGPSSSDFTQVYVGLDRVEQEFSFEPKSYIESIAVRLSFVFEVPENLRTKLTQQLSQVLLLSAFGTNQSPEEMITIETIATTELEGELGESLSGHFASERERSVNIPDALLPQETAIKMWIDGFLNPKDGAFWSFLGTLLLMTGLVSVGFLLRKGSGLLGASIESAANALRPPDESASNAVIAEEASKDQQVVDVEEIDSAHELLSDLRMQVSELLAADAAILQLALGSYLTDPNSRPRISHWIQGIGFQKVQQALVRVDTKLQERFREALSDADSSLSTPNKQVAALQAFVAIYAKVATRVASESDERTGYLVKLLSELSEDDLQSIVTSLSDHEVACLLEKTDTNQAEVIVARLSDSRMDSVLRLLREGGLESHMESLVEKLAQKSAQERKGQSERYFQVLTRAVASADMDSEVSLLSEVGADDWKLKKQLLQDAFPLSYLVDSPPAVLKGIILSLPLRKRAEIALSGNAELQKLLLGLFEEGSNARKAIDVEISEIQKDPDALLALSKSKSKYLKELRERLSRVFVTQPIQQDLLVLKQAARLGVEVPDELRDVAEAIRSRGETAA